MRHSGNILRNFACPCFSLSPVIYHSIWSSNQWFPYVGSILAWSACRASIVSIWEKYWLRLMHYDRGRSATLWCKSWQPIWWLIRIRKPGYLFGLGECQIKHQCYRNKFMVRSLRNLFKRRRFEIYQELKCTYSIGQWHSPKPVDTFFVVYGVFNRWTNKLFTSVCVNFSKQAQENSRAFSSDPLAQLQEPWSRLCV